MRKTNIKVTRYQHGDFWIDIIDYPDGLHEAFLSHKEFGVSRMMFGSWDDRKEFVALVKDRLSDCIEWYENEYC